MSLPCGAFSEKAKTPEHECCGNEKREDRRNAKSFRCHPEMRDRGNQESDKRHKEPDVATPRCVVEPDSRFLRLQRGFVIPGRLLHVTILAPVKRLVAVSTNSASCGVQPPRRRALPPRDASSR